VIRLAKRIPCNPTNNRLIDQFVGSGTSIGANYCEADDSISTGDLRHRISICRKESKETRFWLRMLATAEPAQKDAARILWREATELSLIFGSIWRQLREPKN
jgi:four helix bundle protein